MADKNATFAPLSQWHNAATRFAAIKPPTQRSKMGKPVCTVILPFKTRSVMDLVKNGVRNVDDIAVVRADAITQNACFLYG